MFVHASKIRIWKTFRRKEVNPKAKVISNLNRLGHKCNSNVHRWYSILLGLYYILTLIYLLWHYSRTVLIFAPDIVPILHSKFQLAIPRLIIPSKTEKIPKITETKKLMFSIWKQARRRWIDWKLLVETEFTGNTWHSAFVAFISLEVLPFSLAPWSHIIDDKSLGLVKQMCIPQNTGTSFTKLTTISQTVMISFTRGAACN